MDILGLGVRLNFDDNMTSQINPLIRDLERLRNQANATTQSFNNMNGAYNPFGSNRRRDLQDYYASMQRTDLALLNISNRLINATRSAQGLSAAMNRMQFTGNFNQMYSDINRVQRMLGNMGYGMSKMQKDMSNNRAYNMVNYQMRDLHDRIKLTSAAIKEMQSSPDASKFVSEIDLARRSLQLYQAQLKSMGNLENKFAATSGMGVAKYGGKPVLYEKASNPQDEFKNRLLGATMLDVALASNLAYNSLDRTGKMMVGLGYTTMEARQKLTQMLTTLQMVGMGMTQFATVPLAMVTVGIGMLLNSWEEASNVFHARTLIDPAHWKSTEQALRDMSVDTGATQMETSVAMSASYNIFGDTKGLDFAMEQAERSLFMSKVHGVGTEKALRDVNVIMTKFGVDSQQAWDMYVAGAVEAKKETGKGFTGMMGADRISNYVDENAEALMKMTGALGKYNNSYETMVNAYEKGAMENIIESFGTLGSIIIAVIDPVRPVIEKFFGGIKSGLEGVLGFFREHEAISKFIAYTGMAILAIGMILGPIALATAFLIRYRSVIQGVTQSVVALNKGGLAVLSPQAKMAANLMKSLTVAFARFPQTLLLGAIPALYTFVRGLPGLAIQIMRLNPIMTALTVGTVAYSKNFLGFGDAVDKVVGKVKTSWGVAKRIVANGLDGGNKEFKQFSFLTQSFAKMQGTAKVAKKVLDSIFGEKKLKFTTEEMNLMDTLGITGFVNTIASTGKAVKDFWDGFKEGVELVFTHAKIFYGWMKETFAPVFEFLEERVIKLADFMSKLLGGEGVTSFDDIRLSAHKLNEDVFNLGKLAGSVLTAFLGYKVLKSVFSIFKNPFSSFISSANQATSAVKTMGRAVGATAKSAAGVFNGNTTTRGITPQGSTTIAGGGMNTGTLSNRQVRRLTPQQQGTYARTLQNNAISNRGHDRGTAVHGVDGQRYGSTLYARNQNRFRRALFGQSYDTFDEQGRRVQRERVGGLLNRDRTGMSRVSMRDRIIDGRQEVTSRARSLGSSAMSTARSMGSAFMGTPGMASLRSATATAAKPITVPVKWVTGRLQTAGVIRQGGQAGTQSGNLFKRTFNAVTRVGVGGARVFGSTVRAAGSAGAKAGSATLKGFGVVGKGIGGIFKLGFRAIPFLGWALMAWDIISSIFTNWDKIKSVATKAWNWIKTDGVKALGSAWEWIQEKAGEVWNWILTDGVRIAGGVASSLISWLGQALTWVLIKAGEVFLWILTDGIGMAVDLGADIFKFLGQAFTDLVGWAIDKFGEILSAGWDLGVQIGSSIFEAIKSGFGDIAGWFGGKLSDGWSTIKGWFGSNGGDAKAYARGGIINSPHLGLVGEAGAEAIIPLSGNQRDRARHLLERTAGILGMTVQKVSPEETSIDQFTKQMPVVEKSPTPVSNSVVRKGAGNFGNNGGNKTEDNSISINNVIINVENGKGVNEISAKKLVDVFAKELQKRMKQGKLREGNNLTIEELLLSL